MPLIFCPSDDWCTTWLFGNYAPNKATQKGQYASTSIPNLTIDMLTLWPPWLPVSEFPAAASGNVLATSSAMNPKRRCLASTSRLRWRSRGNVFYGPRKLCSPATQSFGVGFTKHQAWSSTILAATAAGSTPSVQKDFTLTNGKGWKMLKKRPWSTNIHGPCCCSPFASNRMGFISGYYSCTLSIEAELSAAVFALVNSWAPHF